MKILVTGGAGFIGSALAGRLANEGHQVVVVDNFNEYYDVALKRARQQQFLTDIETVEGDITDQAALERLFGIHQFEVVAHVAAQAGVRYSVEHPEVYVQSNVVGTQTLLEVMRQHGCGRMVYASTSSVYGINTPVPFREDQPADKPVSVYAATKRTGELLAHAYHSLYGTDITCLRFFTVYGPWGRPDMALWKFAEAMQMGEPIDVYNNGELRRDFTYIDDIIAGFILAIDKPLGYETVNLGNSRPVELMEFIKTLESELGIEAKKNLLPMQPGDVFETYADITKAQELLGYRAQTNFDEGIKKFVAWYVDYNKKSQ